MRQTTRAFGVLVALVAALVAGTTLTLAPMAAAAAPTTTTLGSSLNPSVVGDSVTLTATVTDGASPTGSVDFADGADLLGSVALDAGGVATLVVSSFSSGTHSLKATYSGDINNDGSVGLLSQVVTEPVVLPTATSTALTSSTNPSVAGKSVTLRATVTGASPTGSVAFTESGTKLGNPSLAGGVATLVVSSWAAGRHHVTAAYSGDAHNQSSVGTLTQTVEKKVKKPTVTLVVSKSKVSVGDKVTLTWRSKHADIVKARGDWSGSRKAKGSVLVRIAERGKHVFKLTVVNAAGRDTARVTVTAARKAKELELVVTDELVQAGTEVDITADGLAKGEDYTIRLNGKPILTGKADKRGDVARTYVLPKTTPDGELPLTITGSNPGRLGTAVLNVLGPKTLEVEVFSPELAKKSQQAVTVTGLLPGEKVTLMYEGEKLTTGEADVAGFFTYTFNVGKKLGKRTVKAIGEIPSRFGTATFTVTKAA